MRFFLLSTLVCIALITAAGAARSTTSTALSCPHGSAQGDWEAVFGRRLDINQANALLARVHRKGFGCAKIENEGGTHEIAVLRMTHVSAAEKIVRKAHRRGFRNAYVARS
jgi:cellobiose-specific phosphotransferase system component IIA